MCDYKQLFTRILQKEINLTITCWPINKFKVDKKGFRKTQCNTIHL